MSRVGAGRVRRCLRPTKGLGHPGPGPTRPDPREMARPVKRPGEYKENIPLTCVLKLLLKILYVNLMTSVSRAPLLVPSAVRHELLTPSCVTFIFPPLPAPAPVFVMFVVLCVVFSSETENRGAGEGEVGSGSAGSDEENNWGMDDSIDVNAVRIIRVHAKDGNTLGTGYEPAERVSFGPGYCICLLPPG